MLRDIRFSSIYYGSTDRLPFATMGSGSLAAMYLNMLRLCRFERISSAASEWLLGMSQQAAICAYRAICCRARGDHSSTACAS